MSEESGFIEIGCTVDWDRPVLYSGPGEWPTGTHPVMYGVPRPPRRCTWEWAARLIGYFGGVGCFAALLGYQLTDIDATPARIAVDHPLLTGGCAFGWFIAWLIDDKEED